MNPTSYSIYCPEAGQKKQVAEWFERMGYKKSRNYSGEPVLKYIALIGDGYTDFYGGIPEHGRKTITFSEWQSMVEEVPPPGIVSFKSNVDGSVCIDPYGNYNEFVKHHTKMNNTIHSISVEGVVFSVGEEVANNYKGGHIIESFKYDYDQWYAYYKNGTGCDRISSLHKSNSPERKIVGWKLMQDLIQPTGTIRKDVVKTISQWRQIFPELTPEDFHIKTDWFSPVYSEPNPPVCELPDENGKMIALYTEDSFWIVIGSTYEIKEKTIALQNPKTFFTNVEFYGATEAAAIKFVRENKPMYPESLVRNAVVIMKILIIAAKQDYAPTVKGAEELIEKLNNYKAKQS